MQSGICLLVEKGEPYVAGTRVFLEKSPVCLGRSSGNMIADVNFNNLLVSRRHCLISLEGDEAVLRDLGSKHGTLVNGRKVAPEETYYLSDGDKIGLAMGMVLVTFSKSRACQETLDLGQTAKLIINRSFLMEMDSDRHECRMGGKSIELTEKEWLFLQLLFSHGNKIVPYPEIKNTVWSERMIEEAAVSDVGAEEMNALVYRVRKKMGKSSSLLKTIRGVGCMLEVTAP